MSTEFINRYGEVMEKTLLTPDRLWYLWYLPRTQVEEEIEGEFAELGVFEGGSAQMVYKSTHGHIPIHLFDTFSGTPRSQLSDLDYHLKNKVGEEDDARGLLAPGSFHASLDEVAPLFNGCENVSIYKGIFPLDTWAVVPEHVFSFVHLDLDIYKPTRDALQLFYEAMAPGGMFVVDDYGSMRGVTEAVNEFADRHKLAVVQTAFMQCVLRKPLPKTVVDWSPQSLLWQFQGG